MLFRPRPAGILLLAHHRHLQSPPPRSAAARCVESVTDLGEPRAEGGGSYIERLAEVMERPGLAPIKSVRLPRKQIAHQSLRTLCTLCSVVR